MKQNDKEILKAATEKECKLYYVTTIWHIS
jgi:hypothetical protein